MRTIKVFSAIASILYMLLSCSEQTAPVLSPCEEKAQMYSYTVFIEYKLTNSSPDTRPVNYLTSGIVPATHPGIRLPITVSGEYEMTIKMTTQECYQCCDSAKKGRLQFKFTTKKELTVQSNGRSNYIPLHPLPKDFTFLCMSDYQCD